MRCMAPLLCYFTGPCPIKRNSGNGPADGLPGPEPPSRMPPSSEGDEDEDEDEDEDTDDDDDAGSLDKLTFNGALGGGGFGRYARRNLSRSALEAGPEPVSSMQQPPGISFSLSADRGAALAKSLHSSRAEYSWPTSTLCPCQHPGRRLTTNIWSGSAGWQPLLYLPIVVPAVGRRDAAVAAAATATAILVSLLCTH